MIATRLTPVLIVCALLVLAGSLAGCGTSSDEGFQSLAPQEMKVAADAGAGATPADAPGPSAIGAQNAALGPKPAAHAAKDSGSKGAAAPIVKVADKYAAPGTPGSSAYKIGPLDVLDISVFKVPELARSVQVADAGTINLPLVGEVQAAGRTASDLERDLAKKLGSKYLQSPQVTVYVKEYNSRRVTIEGAVKKPGVYPIRSKTTLMQFIATAEGPTEAANTDSIVVFRTVAGKRSAAKFDLGQIREGKSEDPAIEEGDVIVVNESATKAAFQNLLKAIPITSAFVPLL